MVYIVSSWCLYSLCKLKQLSSQQLPSGSPTWNRPITDLRDKSKTEASDVRKVVLSSLDSECDGYLLPDVIAGNLNGRDLIIYLSTPKGIYTWKPLEVAAFPDPKMPALLT